MVSAQILNGGGKLSGFESSKFILAYFDSPSRACCLNLDLNSFWSSSISLRENILSQTTAGMRRQHSNVVSALASGSSCTRFISKLFRIFFFLDFALLIDHILFMQWTVKNLKLIEPVQYKPVASLNCKKTTAGIVIKSWGYSPGWHICFQTQLSWFQITAPELFSQNNSVCF